MRCHCITTVPHCGSVCSHAVDGRQLPCRTISTAASCGCLLVFVLHTASASFHRQQARHLLCTQQALHVACKAQCALQRSIVQPATSAVQYVVSSFAELRYLHSALRCCCSPHHQAATPACILLMTLRPAPTVRWASTAPAAEQQHQSVTVATGLPMQPRRASPQRASEQTQGLAAVSQKHSALRSMHTNLRIVVQHACLIAEIQCVEPSLPECAAWYTCNEQPTLHGAACCCLCCIVTPAVNKPGYRYIPSTVGQPTAALCPANTFSQGLARQARCNPCPAGLKMDPAGDAVRTSTAVCSE
jgi:hypothetical protein